MKSEPRTIDPATRERAFAAVRSAIRKVNGGQTPDETCVFCGGLLKVEGMPPGGPFTMWVIRCPCAMSNGEFKGL